MCSVSLFLPVFLLSKLAAIVSISLLLRFRAGLLLPACHQNINYAVTFLECETALNHNNFLCSQLQYHGFYKSDSHNYNIRQIELSIYVTCEMQMALGCSGLFKNKLLWLNSEQSVIIPEVLLCGGGKSRLLDLAARSFSINTLLLLLAFTSASVPNLENKS